MRRYNSFLVRYWQLASAEERVEVKHVQTDRRVVLDSLEDAMRWIATTAAGDGSAEMSESADAGEETAGPAT